VDAVAVESTTNDSGIVLVAARSDNVFPDDAKRPMNSLRIVVHLSRDDGRLKMAKVEFCNDGRATRGGRADRSPETPDGIGDPARPPRRAVIEGWIHWCVAAWRPILLTALVLGALVIVGSMYPISTARIQQVGELGGPT